MLWEDFAGRSALSCQRRRALGAVKLGKQRSLLLLVLLLTLKLRPIGLVFLKIRKVRKKAAVILSIGAYGKQGWEGSKVKLIAAAFAHFQACPPTS